jgi:hypothetical protein
MYKLQKADIMSKTGTDLQHHANNWAKKIWADYELAKSTSENLYKGLEREESLRKFLNGIIPNHMDIVTGEIRDKENIRSNQIDGIIFDQQWLKNLYQLMTVSIVPFELVYACIEVKSNLVKNEFKNFLSKIRSLVPLQPLSKRRILFDIRLENNNLEDNNRFSSPTHSKKPKEYFKDQFPMFIFAYEGVKIPTIKKWLEELNEIPDHWWPRGIYVLNQGALFLKRGQTIQENKSVLTHNIPIYECANTNSMGEVLLFFHQHLMSIIASYELKGFNISEYSDSGNLYEGVFVPKGPLRP